MKTKFKYKNDVSNLTCDCPPLNLFDYSAPAFRFVLDDLDHLNNFEPISKINPKRLNDCLVESKKCDGYSLSLFDTLDNGTKKLKKLLDRKSELKDTLGSNIAEGVLDSADGKSTQVDSIGHFSFYEYENSNIRPKFSIVKRLL